MELHTCYKCGRKFFPGNNADGIPNGVGFVLKDGRIVTFCARCIMKLGEGGDVKITGEVK